MAGGGGRAACQLLDFDTVEARARRRGSTPPAAASQDDTLTCALTQAGHDFPDLTLAVTGSDADELIFAATVTPSGADCRCNGLGRVAYRAGDRARRRRGGPGLEIGWLSGEQAAASSCATPSPPAPPTPEVAALTPKLIALARRRIDDHPVDDEPTLTGARSASLSGRATKTREAISRGSRTMSPSRSTTTASRSWATTTFAPGSTPAACSWRSTSASVCTLSQIRLTIDLAGQAGEGEVALGAVAGRLATAPAPNSSRPGNRVAVGRAGRLAEQLVDLLLDRLAHHVLPAAGLVVGLLVGHADDVDQQQLGEAVLAHDGDRLGPAQVGEQRGGGRPRP